MARATIDELETVCRSLFTRLHRTWSMDDRFGCALLTFKREEKDVLAAVAEACGTPWTASTLPSAPPVVRERVGKFGGLDAGQQFFHLTATNGAVLFGAVWPWGNASTVSLRLGWAADGMDAAARAAADTRFRSWFGL